MEFDEVLSAAISQLIAHRAERNLQQSVGMTPEHFENVTPASSGAPWSSAGC